MQTPFGGKGGRGGGATRGGGGGIAGRCEGLCCAEMGWHANLWWAQTGEQPEKGGEEGGRPHMVVHRRGGKRNCGIGVNLHKCHVSSFLSAFCIVPSPQSPPPIL